MDNVKALNTTLEMSNELVRIREKSFKEGMATSSDVVDAEVVLSKVKTAFLLAYTTNTMWRLPISCPFVVFPKLSTNTGWTVKQRSYKHKTV
ncbi:MAG: TolC family protein [Parabacteroides merdae]